MLVIPAKAGIQLLRPDHGPFKKPLDPGFRRDDERESRSY